MTLDCPKNNTKQLAVTLGLSKVPRLNSNFSPSKEHCRHRFGLVNQVSHYYKLSNIMEPLKAVPSPKSAFLWTEEFDLSFQQSKEELVKAITEGVQIFDPKRQTCLNRYWLLVVPKVL